MGLKATGSGHQQQLAGGRAARHVGVGFGGAILRAKLPGFELSLDEVVVDGHRTVVDVQRQRCPRVEALAGSTADDPRSG